MVGCTFLPTSRYLPSSTVGALKTLMHRSGYGDSESEIEKLGGWELLINPEKHYDGVTLLAR